MPAVAPVTKPVVLIVATAGVALVQVPPTVASANCVVKPTQTAAVPVIGATVGTALTVTVCVAELVQPPLVTE